MIRVSLIIYSTLSAYGTILEQMVSKRGLQPTASAYLETLKFKFWGPLPRSSESETLRVEGAQQSVF